MNSTQNEAEPSHICVAAHFPRDLALWLKSYAKSRPQGGTASQVIRELVADLMARHAPLPVEKNVEIPTTRELRRIAALKRGGL